MKHMTSPIHVGLKFYMSVLLAVLLSGSLVAQEEPVWEMVLDVPVVDFEELQPWLSAEGDTTVIVNFWATWCGPCVQELPLFNRVYHESDDPIKLVLVSLDFEGSTRKKLIPFINKNRIYPEVVHLVDYKMNSWIDRISPKWSGALPATIVKRNGEVYFHEGKFKEYSDLTYFINRK